MRFIFAENAFKECIVDAVNLANSDAFFKGAGSPLRGGLLLIVGGFDFLVHEMIRLEIGYRVSIKDSNLILAVPFNMFAVDNEKISREVDLYVRKNNSYKSFVGSANIKECFKDLSIDIWSEYEKKTNKDKNITRKKLDKIWQWRNRIAHEGDLVPSNTSFEYWPIYKDDVMDAALFLKELGTDLLKTVRALPSP